jgi:inorganic pyrophosphatase/exopolyphosphatase
VSIIYVSGHRNPDTDAIGAAIGFAELKTALDPDNEYVPVRLGELNPQTRWVLERAKANEPVALPHIRLRAQDLMATEFPVVGEDDPVQGAGLAIDGTDYDLVPVLGEDGVLVGAITIRGLALRYVHEPQTAAESLQAPSRELMQTPETLARPDDLCSEIHDKLRAAEGDTAIVVDESQHPIGLLTRAHLASPAVHRRVILVDHAEEGQSVPGIEQAEIVEILDHHHIGSIETRVPIKAVFDPVGSTSTLVLERFVRNGIEPSRPTATMLLGAILSDTVILNSVTTTDRDEAALEYLGKLLGLDPREFGAEMFESTSDVSGIPAADLVRRDAKPYTSGNGTPFLVAQIEVVGKSVLERKDELLAAMQRERSAQGADLFALMVTDILDKGTELLVAGDVTAAARAFGVEVSNGSSLSLPGVMSRKKQVAPKLLAAL